MRFFRVLVPLALAAALPQLVSAAPSTELVADRMEMVSTGDETRAVCEGNVVLTSTNLKITCERLEVVAVRIGEEDEALPAIERFKYLLATGRVHIVQGDREATCGRAEVLPREDKVVLTEDPVLLDRSSDYVAAGERITLWRGERRVEIEKPRFTGPPLKDLSAEAEDAPPAPPQP